MGIKAQSISYLKDSFKRINAPWSIELQGLCHDENNFYVTQRYFIWKIPRSLRIENIKSQKSNQVVKIGIPESLQKLGANHMGDCDVYDQKVFIPLEGTTPVRMLILSTADLSLIAAPEIKTGQIQAPWVTLDPRDGTIFTGNFDIDKNSPIYKLKFNPVTKELEIADSIFISKKDHSPLKISRIQGADISISKNLMIFASDTKKSGLIAIDLNSFEFVLKNRINYFPGFPVYEELEGIDVLEDDEEFSQYRGNIFVPILNNNLIFNDYGKLKNFQLD